MCISSGAGRSLEIPGPAGLEVPIQSLTQLELLLPDRSTAKGHQDAYHAFSSEYKSALDDVLQETRNERQFASVLFNEEAADNIIKNCLYPVDPLSGVTREGCPPLPTVSGRWRLSREVPLCSRLSGPS